VYGCDKVTYRIPRQLNLPSLQTNDRNYQTRMKSQRPGFDDNLSSATTTTTDRNTQTPETHPTSTIFHHDSPNVCLLLAPLKLTSTDEFIEGDFNGTRTADAHQNLDCVIDGTARVDAIAGNYCYPNVTYFSKIPFKDLRNNEANNDKEREFVFRPASSENAALLQQRSEQIPGDDVVCIATCGDGANLSCDTAQLTNNDSTNRTSSDHKLLVSSLHEHLFL